MKLAPRYFGPYEVLEKVGPVAYKLALPNGSQIHDVFHVSLLSKHIGTLVNPISVTLPYVTDEGVILPQLEAVIDRRVIHKGKYHPKSEVLIKWKGARVEDDTWENEWRFRK
ncbi:transposon ty3-G gag-pol polyprotein [Tanacetum coccineum]